MNLWYLFDSHFPWFSERVHRASESGTGIEIFCHLHCIIYALVMQLYGKFHCCAVLCCILAKAIHLLLYTIFHRGLSNGWRRVEDRFLSYVVYHQPLSSIKVSTLVLRSLATNKTKSGKRILFNNKHSQDVWLAVADAFEGALVLFNKVGRSLCWCMFTAIFIYFSLNPLPRNCFGAQINVCSYFFWVVNLLKFIERFEIVSLCLCVL